jgi:DNA-binding CsgD family transcriptional regulator/tetratricopeptide (TPR) repeat protein
MSDGSVERARAAFRRMAWRDAFAEFQEADGLAALAVDDLERAARSAQLAGMEADADRFWQRAIDICEAHGDPERAARNAFWLGMSLMHRGESAQAGGWAARATRLLDEHGLDSAVSGYLKIPAGLQALFGGDAEGARPAFESALLIGERFQERDLIALSRLGLGSALLALGTVHEGISMLDDAMLSVTRGEVSPLVSGIVYCAVIETCHELFDLRRAREWTDALSRWCEIQTDLIPFRGQCLVHRAQLMYVNGAWPEAMLELQHACDRLLEPPPQPAVGEALYCRAELHRLRGELDAAEALYRESSEWGREPQPGLARLRMAQGQLDAAENAIRRVVADNQARLERTPLLAAFVDIMLAIDDVPSARAAAEELCSIAADVDTSYLGAVAAYATGAVELADGDAQTAIRSLRRASVLWSELDAPYDQARARVLIGRACGELGDDDTASLELEAARRCFEHLGATHDLECLAQQTHVRASAVRGLTGREIEVLELIAAGHTNRQIAAQLFISEKTVARHVANIFSKIAVTTRAAATAYAFRHGLT